ncbi:MAG: EI24 domain-containing protein [Rubrivivax sp.]
MKEVLDAFWRAAIGCLHPRVILWSLLPLMLAGAIVGGLGWFFWAPAVDAVRQTLAQWSVVTWALQWLESLGAGVVGESIAPLIVVAAALPLVVILTLLLVAWLMTPVLVEMIVSRRFPTLEKRAGLGAWWLGLLWTGVTTLAALVVLALSLPLWWVPPLPLLVPPLVWGWLTARVMAYDALAGHASHAERRQILRTLRWPLLGMGIVCGLLGSAPTVLWALGALSVLLAPVVVMASIWLYTLVFAFASLWFGHYTLAQLVSVRAAATGVVARPSASPAQAVIDVVDVVPDHTEAPPRRGAALVPWSDGTPARAGDPSAPERDGPASSRSRPQNPTSS